MNKQYVDEKYKKFIKEIEKFNRKKAVELLEEQLRKELQYPIQERILK